MKDMIVLLNIFKTCQMTYLENIYNMKPYIVYV